MAHAAHDILSPSLGIAADWSKAEAYGSFSQYPGAHLHDAQDILWYFTGLPHWDFNGIFRARFRPDKVDSKIRETLDSIYRVAVIPEARGRGIGSAISMAPLGTARELGYGVAVLNPSDMSYGMYKRLGFQECYKMSLYVWEPR